MPQTYLQHLEGMRETNSRNDTCIEMICGLTYFQIGFNESTKLL